MGKDKVRAETGIAVSNLFNASVSFLRACSSRLVLKELGVEEEAPVPVPDADGNEQVEGG